MRLDKYICESTELSRKQAKVILHRGEVTVDDLVCKNSALKLAENSQVKLNGQLLSVIGQRYIMMNKAINTICSTIDEEYPSVLSSMEISKLDKLHIAGRLDVDTTGLVLITDDGQWSHNITSPNKQCHKRYKAKLAEVLTADDIQHLETGVMLNGESAPTLPATVEVIDEHTVYLSIREGKYHQVKRMFAAVGNKVTQLHREKIGSLELDPALSPGQWRHLSPQELEALKA